MGVLGIKHQSKAGLAAWGKQMEGNRSFEIYMPQAARGNLHLTPRNGFQWEAAAEGCAAACAVPQQHISIPMWHDGHVPLAHTISKQKWRFGTGGPHHGGWTYNPERNSLHFYRHH